MRTANYPRLARLLVHVPVLALTIFFVINGLIGLDFGKHWDEAKIPAAVKRSIEEGVLLPRWYKYPSMSFDIAMLAIAPDAARLITNSTETDVEEQLIDRAESKSYLARVRSFFLVISSLTIIWTYLLVLVWRKSWIEALIAAALVACSWEFGYHARWVAPDTIMAQFGALTMLCLIVATQQPNVNVWLRFGAAAGGLAFATKYTGVLFAVPLIVASFALVTTWRQWIATSSTNLVVFGLSYLLASPGSVLDYQRSIEHVRFEMTHYATGHGGYSVDAGFDHLRLMLTYLAGVLFSPYAGIALFFAAMVLIGVYALQQERRPIAALLLCFPVIYIALIASQRVMIVRNLLVLLPFLAVFAARGVMYVQQTFLQHQRLRVVYALAVVALLSVNVGWSSYAAQSIAQRKQIDEIRFLASYLEHQPDTRFWISDTIRGDLLERNIYAPVSASINEAQAAVFYSNEVGQDDWQANRYDYTRTWFGPYEVNFNYYPSWVGEKHIVVMDIDKAKALASLELQ